MKKDVKSVMDAATQNVNMAIYTKTGDKGTTSNLKRQRIPKSDPQVEAYGSIDELTSFIGLAIIKLKDKNQQALLTEVQKDLYQIMSFLAGANIDLAPLEKKIDKFEQTIDRIQSKLTKLNTFILPGGNELSSWFHILRAITRRSERSTVNYFHNNSAIQQFNNKLIIKYLNRLSDLFFILARKHNER